LIILVIGVQIYNPVKIFCFKFSLTKRGQFWQISFLPFKIDCFMNNYLPDTGRLFFIQLYGWITIFLWIVIKNAEIELLFCMQPLKICTGKTVKLR